MAYSLTMHGAVKAPEPLRALLAEHDVACDGCGYNLRGAAHVQCPECGCVIPRPAAAFLKRAALDPATIRLRCSRCFGVIEGVNALCCPDCRSEDLDTFSGDPPRGLRRWRWIRATPWPLSVTGVVGLTSAAGCATAAVLHTVAGRSRSAADAWVAVLLCLAPAGIALAWAWTFRSLVRLGPTAGRALALACWMLGTALLIAGLRAL